MKKIIIIIFLLVLGLGSYYYFNQKKITTESIDIQNNYSSEIFLTTEFSDTNVDFINTPVVQNDEWVIDNKLIVVNKNNNKKQLVDTYQFAGYNEEKIEEIFVYPSGQGDILTVITSWDSSNQALGLYGNFYEVYFYNSSLEKQDKMMDLFEAGYDGETDMGVFSYPYKTKESVITHLKELGY